MRVVELEAFPPLENVKDELLPLASLNGHPVAHVLQSIMEKPPAVICGIESTYPQIPFQGSVHASEIGELGYALWQVNDRHARSFIIEHPDLANGIEDEFGNRFNVFTLKGNNLSNPGVIESPTADNGYIAYGLQESTVIRRVLKASRMLRELGVGTEYIIGFSEPKQLPYPDVRKQTDEHITLGRNAYKHQIVMDAWNSLDASEQTFEKLQEIQQAFINTTHLVTVRAMDSAYRVSDILQDRSALDEVASSVFEAGVQADKHRYFNEYLAPRLADNLAVMHNAGLAHRFLHSGNISVHGSIIDLDSVHGEPLGLDDDPISVEDIAKDITDAIFAMHSTDLRAIVRSDRPIAETFINHYIERYLAEDEGNREMAVQILELVRQEIEESDGLEYGLGLQRFLNTRIPEMQRAIIGDDSLSEADQAIRDFFKDSEDEIMSVAIENAKMELESIFDDILLHVANEVPEYILDGEFGELFLWANHRDMISNALEPYFRAASMSVYKQETTLEGPKSSKIATLEQQPLFRESIKVIVSRAKSEFWPGLSDALTQAFDLAATAEEELYPNPEPLYMGSKGKIIYSGHFDNVEHLRVTLMDESAEIIHIDPSELRGTTHTGGKLYIGSEKKVIQVLTIGWGDFGLEGYGTGVHEHTEVLDISFSELQVVVLLVEGDDGQKRLEVLSPNESIVDEDVINDPRAFQSLFNNMRPLQTKLFNDDDYIDYHGSAEFTGYKYQRLR